MGHTGAGASETRASYTSIRESETAPWHRSLCRGGRRAGEEVDSKVVLVSVALLFAVWLALPQFRNATVNLIRPSEGVTVTLRGETRAPVAPGAEAGDEDSGFKMVTLLGFDAIPAILEPEFVTATEADAWMRPDEQVLALSINGENKAYSVPLLSRHEIVNDVVGGVPVAVTW